METFTGQIVNGIRRANLHCFDFDKNVEMFSIPKKAGDNVGLCLGFNLDQRTETADLPRARPGLLLGDTIEHNRLVGERNPKVVVRNQRRGGADQAQQGPTQVP